MEKQHLIQHVWNRTTIITPSLIPMPNSRNENGDELEPVLILTERAKSSPNKGEASPDPACVESSHNHISSLIITPNSRPNDNRDELDPVLILTEQTVFFQQQRNIT